MLHKRFRINAHRALKVLLFPPPKHLNRSNPIANKVLSVALLGSYTVERHEGNIAKRKKEKYHKLDRSDWSQTHKILDHLDLSGFNSTVGVRGVFSTSQASFNP